MVLFTVVLINFVIPRMMPGNPIDKFAGGVKLTVEARQALIARFGLDAPLWQQFCHYFINAFRGDFGLSFSYFPTPVLDVVAQALPWTLLVLGFALILQVIIGYILGVTSGWKAGSNVDSVLQTGSLAVFSTPVFWLGMVFLFIFGFQLGWFPLVGAHSIGTEYSSTLEHIADIMKHAALPIIVLTIGQYAVYQLILRNTMVGVLREQYILTAEAKGLSENRIKYRHAARNALLPMVTFLALSSAMAVGGSVYVETIFSYPGIGLLIYDSVLSRDYPVMQGCFFMFGLVVVIANFIVDILYMYLDPRIRY